MMERVYERRRDRRSVRTEEGREEKEKRGLCE